jgi:hypothetical protein
MTKNEVAALFLGFAFGLLFSGILLTATIIPGVRKDVQMEAVQKGFGEFMTDGEQIEFKWKN